MNFSHRFVDTFPGDSSYEISSRQTPGMLYALARPTPVKAPQLLAWSQDIANKFNLTEPEKFSSSTDLLSGNLTEINSPNDLKPYAACYGGHQFGHWADQLGDGRAITLGELKINNDDSSAQKNQLWDLQLKGAGRTAYSRFADGRAVLRSSLREFIASEAMHHLGVPTTRALSLCLTGDQVVRDIMYDGHPKNEPGAIVTRMAPTFIRFGNFEILAARGEKESLQKLADYVIEHFYKNISLNDPSRIHRLFEAVSENTATTIAHWMRVGFVHGVMNTDNMSILGQTIDYGPYGFLDNYDPMWTPNTTDLPGRRYCYGRQPYIAQWNLARLAEALLILVPDQIEKFQATVESFDSAFRLKHLETMSQKLGLSLSQNETDLKWLNRLEKLLLKNEVDMTYFYRHLTDIALAKPTPALEDLQKVFYKPILDPEDQVLWQTWLNEFSLRVQSADLAPQSRFNRMKLANPVYLPRNFLLQEVIDSLEAGDAEPDTSLLNRFMKALATPYEKQPSTDDFLRMRPEWALNKVGCSTLSCSS